MLRFEASGSPVVLVSAETGGNGEGIRKLAQVCETLL